MISLRSSRRPWGGGEWGWGEGLQVIWQQCPGADLDLGSGSLGKACSEIITHREEKLSYPAQGWGFRTSSISCRCASAGFSCIIPFRDAPPTQGQSSDLLGRVYPSVPCAGVQSQSQQRGCLVYALAEFLS